MLCSEDNDDLTAGERLRVMRLRAGYTIEQAARAVGVGWRVIMNYELGKVKRRKQGILDKLFDLYSFTIKNKFPIIGCEVGTRIIWQKTESEKAQRLSRLFLFSRYDFFPQFGKTVQRVI